ncbi:MAG: DNA repair protein RadA [Bacteroidetes bacterium]|nr:DNA repair protein RadA [Bacteroidota bacterium]MCK6609475.1 DNA repair protein RadA [Bacteroidia bacterium]
MAKTQTTFFCKNCGASSAKWIGKCPSCNEWNTYVEEVIHKDKPDYKSTWKKEQKKAQPTPLPEIEKGAEYRLPLKDAELARVLGGGLVPGSVVLVGGEPGIGKSTLLLQLALQFDSRKVLYISGEESESQIKMRAERISFANPNCYLYTETSTQQIGKALQQLQPDLVIADSIQTLQSELIDSTPGSISQIRETAGDLIRFAKETGTPVFLIGHITKDGNLAGPKLLEHMVDTVLQFEGDRHHVYRILRSTKNRFGSTNEIGIYEMQAGGLREVSNPSEILISQREDSLSGISISASLEGMRPLLIETQALVSQAVYGTPQRNSNGYDSKRLNMLLAILEKKCGLRMGMQDVFVNIAGGLRVEDPGIDLGIVAAIVSSYESMPIDKEICFVGEVGLSGEIRAVTRIEQRISEAEKLGFKTIYLSKYNKLKEVKSGIKIVEVSKIEELLNFLFG